MALPMLPGFSPNKNLGKEKFHKSQHFDYSHGVPFLVGSEKPGIGGELLLGQQPQPRTSSAAGGSNVPSWLQFDKKVLSFDGHFQEPVFQKREETYRVRKCKIYIFLEDDTVQVVEPEVKNSGISQGTLIRRQRVPLPAPDDGRFFTWRHFNLGQQVVLFSRTFTLTDCDAFTSGFLRDMGVRVNAPVSTPGDPYSDLRRKMEESMRPRRPYERQDTLRHKLPKKTPVPHLQPGEDTTRTVLNVFGPMGHRGRYLLDNLRTGTPSEDYYKDCDLVLGSVINVWGRNVLLCDWDDFTKDFYQSKYGIEELPPVDDRVSPAPRRAREVPPYNGFGSEEDSLSSCKGLVLKPPAKDVKKLREKDRQGIVSNVLRFVGKMVSDIPVDTERMFIISYHLSDDTLSVYERTQRNLGVIGGKFLERGRVKTPGQEVFKSDPSRCFRAQDLYVGARLCLNAHEFQLTDADEFTLSYMEQNAEEFPRANIGTIVSKLRSLSADRRREITQFLALSDPESTGVIQYESFRRLLDGADCQLSEHEILALGRRYSAAECREEAARRRRSDPGLRQQAAAVTQERLKKSQYESFSDMAKAFLEEDRARTGWLASAEARVICKAFRIPLPDSLLMTLFNQFENEAGEIDYNSFLATINWRVNPLPRLPRRRHEVQCRWERRGERSSERHKLLRLTGGGIWRAGVTRARTFTCPGSRLF
ncbi:hypothetical protein AAFF_G00219650 [Aldrovandia affinis]|uniref:EF-hand domain-containing family member C2 n=1 Tax=Aldrovandia affinis TaxID=143900 RepID=A0AAD7RGA4_9TELE|nr:hypothetical protein AAFF_G00219650 [Aldrovandia affinis]